MINGCKHPLVRVFLVLHLTHLHTRVFAHVLTNKQTRAPCGILPLSSSLVQGAWMSRLFVLPLSTHQWHHIAIDLANLRRNDQVFPCGTFLGVSRLPQSTHLPCRIMCTLSCNLRAASCFNAVEKRFYSEKDAASVVDVNCHNKSTRSFLAGLNACLDLTTC